MAQNHGAEHSKSLSPLGRQNSLQPAVRQYSGIFIFRRKSRKRGSLRIIGGLFCVSGRERGDNFFERWITAQRVPSWAQFQNAV
jgi:hypothetical protein